VGGRAGQVPACCGPDRCRTAHEEGNVGSVLVGSPALLQVPVHLSQSGSLCTARSGGCQEWQGSDCAHCIFTNCGNLKKTTNLPVNFPGLETNRIL